MHTDPTNAARVRPEQTDAKTLTRSQNEYESITFEQSCEQVPNEAAVEAELEEHASLQHGHGHTCRKPPRWPPRRPQHRPARPGGGPSVGTGPPEVRGAAGAAQVDVVYAFTDSMCLLEQLTCRSTKAEALYGERVTSATRWRTSAMDSRASRLIWPSRTRWAVSSFVKVTETRAEAAEKGVLSQGENFSNEDTVSDLDHLPEGPWVPSDAREAQRISGKSVTSPRQGMVSQACMSNDPYTRPRGTSG